MEPRSVATPTVSVGMPVYNGERYLAAALESLVDQNFDDLEIIVSDNCSTDATETIARSFASRDPRVRYVRNSRNIGAAPNFNQAFALSAGRYFKWAAHDDVCLPDFVGRCVEALEADPDAVLAYPSPLDIDEDGRVIGPRDAGRDFTKETPFARFRDQMVKAHAALPLFGVIRAHVLERTPLHGNYHGADRVLLAELALYGKFLEVPEQLYLHREHPRRGTYAHATNQEHVAWYKPDRAGLISFPWWQRLGGYLSAATRAPIGASQTARCYVQMLGWCKGMRSELVGDLSYAARHVRRRGVRGAVGQA